MGITFLIFSSSLFLRIDSNDENKEWVCKAQQKWKAQKLWKFINIDTLTFILYFETGWTYIH